MREAMLGKKLMALAIMTAFLLLAVPLYAQSLPPTPPQFSPHQPSLPEPPKYSPVTPSGPTGPPPSGLPGPSTGAREKGTINPRTGEFYPGTYGGVIDPKTGVFLPKVDGGYKHPETGEVIPRKE